MTTTRITFDDWARALEAKYRHELQAAGFERLVDIIDWDLVAQDHADRDELDIYFDNRDGLLYVNTHQGGLA